MMYKTFGDQGGGVKQTLFTSKFHDVARILSPYCCVFILHEPFENLSRKLNAGNSHRRAFRPKDILSAAENKLFISCDPRKPNLRTSENCFATADISDPRSNFKPWFIYAYLPILFVPCISIIKLYDTLKYSICIIHYLSTCDFVFVWKDWLKCKPMFSSEGTTVFPNHHNMVLGLKLK